MSHDEPRDEQHHADLETGNVSDDNRGGIGSQERPHDDYGGMPPTETAGGASPTTVKPPEDVTGYFGPRRKRLFTISILLLWFCLLVAPRWADYDAVGDSMGDKWMSAYELHIAGVVFILVGLFFAFLVAILEPRVGVCDSRLWKLIVAGILILGGFIYWVGGIQLAKSINDVGRKQDKEHEYHMSGWAGTCFIESTFIGLLAGTFGLDLIFDFLSKSEQRRVYLVFNTILTFTSLVAFFSYAAWRGYAPPSTESKLSLKNLDYTQTGCVAAGWFFVLVACVYWYTIEFAEICCKCSASARTCVRERNRRMKVAGIIILIFGAFLVMAGMWAIGSTSDSRWNCYYVGYGFFVLFFAIFMSFDIVLGRIIQERRPK